MIYIIFNKNAFMVGKSEFFDTTRKYPKNKRTRYSESTHKTTSNIMISVEVFGLIPSTSPFLGCFLVVSKSSDLSTTKALLLKKDISVFSSSGLDVFGANGFYATFRVR
jgi:hypothetical protein